MSSSPLKTAFLSHKQKHATVLYLSSLHQAAITIGCPNVFYLGQKEMGFSANHHQLRLLSVNSQDKAKESSNISSVENKDSTGKEKHQQESLTANEVLKRLKRYGLSGVLSYGLLNTAYYLCTFLFVWLYVAPAPGRMGYVAAAERFLKVLAMVWAGSQVTKLIRAGGALAFAPAVDRGLAWFTIKFKFESQGKVCFHGNSWIMLWTGFYGLPCTNIALGIKFLIIFISNVLVKELFW